MDTPTRRTLLGGIALTLTGASAIALTPQNTAAAITINGLSIPDKTASIAPGETVEEITLEVTGEFDYKSSHPIDRRQVRLLVNPNGQGYEAMASDDLRSDVPQEVTGETVVVSTNLFDHPALDADMVTPDTGGTVTHSLDVRLELRLFKNGERVALADAETTGVSLSISKEELTVSAQIGGTGGMTVHRGTTTG